MRNITIDNIQFTWKVGRSFLNVRVKEQNTSLLLQSLNILIESRRSYTPSLVARIIIQNFFPVNKRQSLLCLHSPKPAPEENVSPSPVPLPQRRFCLFKQSNWHDFDAGEDRNDHLMIGIWDEPARALQLRDEYQEQENEKYGAGDEEYQRKQGVYAATFYVEEVNLVDGLIHYK